MKKVIMSLVAVGTILTYSSVNDDSVIKKTQENKAISYKILSNHNIEQVSLSKAEATTGTYRTKADVSVYLDAGTSYKVTSQAKSGTNVIATYKKTNNNEVWFKVNVNGTTGYINSSSLEHVTIPTLSKAEPISGTYITNENVNVRLDASTAYNTVLTATKGTKVTATFKKTNNNGETWYKVSVNGKAGYILSTLLSTAPLAKEKVTVPATTQKSTGLSNATPISGTYVTQANTNVRLDASSAYNTVTTAPKGTKLTVTFKKSNSNGEVWYKTTVNGKSGYILSDLLTKSTATAPAPATGLGKAEPISGTFAVTTNTVLRLDASSSYQILQSVPKGTLVTATFKKTNGNNVWYKVTVNGKTGYVLSSLLTTATTKTSLSKAEPISGTFVTTVNTNIRLDAGSAFATVGTATKGAYVTATYKKTSNGEIWYKVNANGKVGYILSSLLESAKSEELINSNMINIAQSLKGTPYRYGGSTPLGFDCSGFVSYVFNKAGYNISRSTLTQFAQTTTVSNPQPGDLIFFQNTYRAGISHVGIYIGNNQFIHAGGSKAEVKSVNDSYWGSKFHSYKRLNK